MSDYDPTLGSHALTIIQQALAERFQYKVWQDAYWLVHRSPASHHYSGFPEDIRQRLRECCDRVRWARHGDDGADAALRAALVEAAERLSWMSQYPNRNAVAIAMWRYGQGSDFKARQALFLSGDAQAHAIARDLIVPEYPLHRCAPPPPEATL